MVFRDIGTRIAERRRANGGRKLARVGGDADSAISGAYGDVARGSVAPTSGGRALSIDYGAVYRSERGRFPISPSALGEFPRITWGITTHYIGSMWGRGRFYGGALSIYTARYMGAKGPLKNARDL